MFLLWEIDVIHSAGPSWLADALICSAKPSKKSDCFFLQREICTLCENTRAQLEVRKKYVFIRISHAQKNPHTSSM